MRVCFQQGGRQVQRAIRELEIELRVAIQNAVSKADTVTEYRETLIGLASADDPRFGYLREAVSPVHLMPEDLVPGARAVFSFFRPFASWVVEANAHDGNTVALNGCRRT